MRTRRDIDDESAEMCERALAVRGEAYLRDSLGVVANPSAGDEAWEFVARLAVALERRDGRPPCWWRMPLPDAKPLDRS